MTNNSISHKKDIKKAESHLSFGVFRLTYCNVQLAWLHTERWNTHLYPILAVTHRLENVLEISFVYHRPCTAIRYINCEQREAFADYKTFE